MSEKLTRLTIPGESHWRGYMDWGEIAPENMIEHARMHYQRQKDDAEKFLACNDDEFQIDVVRGNIVQHFVKELQRSSRHDANNPHQ